MTCAEQQKALALLASDDLDEVATQSLRQHLLICGDCRDQLAQYRDGVDWVRRQRMNGDPVEMSHELQRRLVPQVAARPPLVKPWAVIRRTIDQLAPLRHEHLVAGCAALLLLVGATGTLRGPLSLWKGGAEHAAQSDGSLAVARVPIRHPSHRHLPHSGLEEPNSLGQPGDFADLGSGALSEAGSAAALADKFRIEMQTRDPDVRIIWFAQADTR